MFPRGIPSAAFDYACRSVHASEACGEEGSPLKQLPNSRRIHKCPTDMQLPRQLQVRLVITRILRPPHPARPAGRRNPPPRFRSTASQPPATLLFLTKSGLPFTTSKLLHLVRSYAITHSTTTHSLRHACATDILRGGASIRHVQEMLGHSSLKTTQIYTHIVKDDLKAIHAKTAPSERRAASEAPALKFTNWRPRKQRKPRKKRNHTPS